MNLFWREIKAHRNALIIWSIGALVLVASGMSKYAVYSSSGQSMNEIISKMPKSLQVLLGMGPFDLSKAEGYYAFLYIYLVLLATIHAVLLGSTIIAKEERDRTSEFLIVKPISRNSIVTAKLLAALTNIFVLNMAALVSSIAIVAHYAKGEFNPGKIVILMAGMFMLQLIFMLLGSAMGAILKNPKTPPSFTAVMLFAAYLLSLLIDLNSRLEFLQYLTPFKYFEAKNIIVANRFSPVFTLLSLVIIAALIVATYRSYNKRDAAA